MMGELLGVERDWIDVTSGKTNPLWYFPKQFTSDGFLSENHSKLPNGQWSSGGPFLSAKREYIHRPSEPVTVVYPVQNRPAYTGRFITQLELVPPGPSILRDLTVQGTKFYKDAAPARPLMGLANAAYELKDLPAMLKQRFLDNGLAGIHDLNLAYQFGWKPLLSDMRNLYNTQTRMKAALEQVIKDNGKPVRRRIRNDKRESTTFVSRTEGHYPQHHPTFITQMYGDRANNYTLIEEVVEESEWFSAQYRYWLPEKGGMPDWQWRQWMVMRLFGLKVTPAVVYNAVPWSWLLDWFTNVGDCIENLDHGVADRLITDYAFVMGTQRNYTRRTAAGSYYVSDHTTKMVTAISEYGFTGKQRVPATPFGFGVREDDLSPTQIGILTSLAGSRQ